MGGKKRERDSNRAPDRGEKCATKSDIFYTKKRGEMNLPRVDKEERAGVAGEKGGVE